MGKAIVFLVLFLLPLPSHAGDDVKAKTLALYRDATRSYNVGEYREALDLYKQGYKLSGDAAFLFNIGQCHRQLGEASEAAQAYRAFLRSKPDTSNRTEVEQRIQDMEQVAQQAEARKPPTNIEPPRVAPPPAEPAHVEVAPAVTPVADEPRPWYKRAWVWGVVGGAAAAVALAVVLGVVLGGSPSDPVPTVGAIRAN
jgi:tetratricopeptide (TPR) repeat protein